MSEFRRSNELRLEENVISLGNSGSFYHYFNFSVINAIKENLFRHTLSAPE